MIGKQTLCYACKRFRPSLDGPTCSAFPDGIPDRIIRDGFDHRRPFPGDGGQRFVQRDDTPLPSGYAEDVQPQAPVLIARPEIPVRHQTRKELRETAKNLIAQVKASQS